MQLAGREICNQQHVGKVSQKILFFISKRLGHFDGFGSELILKE
jgi:hypothetical protein